MNPDIDPNIIAAPGERISRQEAMQGVGASEASGTSSNIGNVDIKGKGVEVTTAEVPTTKKGKKSLKKSLKKALKKMKKGKGDGEGDEGGTFEVLR
jgi:hypothetical protein